MADNVPITAGSGTSIATDDVASVHFQKVKLDVGGDGVSIPATGDATNGLDVDVTRVGGNVTVVQSTPANLRVDASGVAVPVTDNAGSLTVDSPQLPAALVGGRLDVNVGAASAVPVTDNASSLTVDDGGLSITVDTPQLPAALVGGRLDVNVGASAALPVTDNGGSLTVDGAVTVSGTVTGNQGTPNTNANGWPVKVTDGVDAVGISTVGAAKALKVDVIQDVGNVAVVDKSAFTEGTGKAGVAGAVFNDAISSNPTEDQAAALRITALRGLHVNLRNAAGTEVGTAAAPVRTDPTGGTPQPVSGTVAATLSASTNAGAAAKTADFDTGGGTDTVAMFGVALPKSGGAVAGGTSTDPLRTDPTGSTIQPVSGTVTADQGTANATPWNENLAEVGGATVVSAAAGVQKVGISDEAGANFTDTNPLPVSSPGNRHRTIRRATIAYTASQTDIAILTPGGGLRLVIESIAIKVSGAGELAIFFGSETSANAVLDGNWAVDDIIVLTFPNGHPADAINDVLRYTSGATAAGRITVFGYEV